MGTLSRTPSELCPNRKLTTRWRHIDRSHENWTYFNLMPLLFSFIFSLSSFFTEPWTKCFIIFLSRANIKTFHALNFVLMLKTNREADWYGIESVGTWYTNMTSDTLSSMCILFQSELSSLYGIELYEIPTEQNGGTHLNDSSLLNLLSFFF